MKKVLIVAAASVLTAGAVIGVVAFAQSQAQSQQQEDPFEPARVKHGKDKLGKLKTIRTTSEVTFYNPQGFAYGRAKQVTSIDFKSREIKVEAYQQDKLTSVILVTRKNPQAWSISGEVADIPEADAKRLRLMTMFGPYALRSDASEKGNHRRLGFKKINIKAGTSDGLTTETSSTNTDGKAASGTVLVSSSEIDANEIEVAIDDGETIKMMMNPDTNLVAEESFNSFDGEPQRFEFADYRAVDGLQVPFETRLSRNGLVAAIERVSEVQINAPLKKADFVLPR